MERYGERRGSTARFDETSPSRNMNDTIPSRSGALCRNVSRLCDKRAGIASEPVDIAASGPVLSKNEGTSRRHGLTLRRRLPVRRDFGSRRRKRADLTATPAHSVATCGGVVAVRREVAANEPTLPQTRRRQGDAAPYRGAVSSFRRDSSSHRHRRVHLTAISAHLRRRAETSRTDESTSRQNESTLRQTSPRSDPAPPRRSPMDPGAPASRKIDTPSPPLYNPRPCGAVAQLGERLNGIQEVEGSTPFGSTNSFPEIDNRSGLPAHGGDLGLGVF
jgi:hypothetical protein